METTVVTVKGQATIPVGLRRHLGVGPGDHIGFEVDGEGRVIVKKCSREAALWAKALEPTLLAEWGSSVDDDL